MTIKRCTDCGKARPMFRRGRCWACWDAYRASPAYVPGVPGGKRGPAADSLRTIARALGISHVTVKHALERGRLIQTDSGWAYTPGVPGRPRTKG